MNFVTAIISSIIYVAILIVTYYIHVNFVRVDVIFYAAILDSVIASIITCLLFWFLPVARLLSNLEKVLLVSIWLISGYSFAISVPTVVDRSLSFYILEKLEQRGGGIQQDRFEEVFVKEYMVEHRLVDVRLTEQLQSGTIDIQNGCVLLTEKGYKLTQFSRYFRKNWLAKQRLLMGKYSDDLTDPFRNSKETPDYTCSKESPQ